MTIFMHGRRDTESGDVSCGATRLPLAHNNASLQLLPEAGATQERRLEAVACKPLFGKRSGSILGHDMGP